jgi:putative ABC transport system permease protein
MLAVRNMIKYWRYTLTNILGLAIGLTSVLLIFLYIQDELQYDRFHKKSERIYRVNRWYNTQDVNEDAATCSFPCGPAILADYPHLVENMVRFFDFQVPEMLFEHPSKKDTIRYNESSFYLADSTVFDIFSFEFIHGDPQKALTRPNSLIITESTAQRYFGNANPLGKRLILEEWVDMEVTGVIEDLPPQSHMRIDLLGSLSTYRMLQGRDVPDQLLGPLTRYRQTKLNRYPETWVWNPCWTYLLLRPGVKQESLEARFDEFYKKHYKELSNQNVTLYLQALSDIHLYSDHAFEMKQNSNISYIFLLSLTALVILFLATSNLVNLSTAISYTRAREIGMKKVFGGTPANFIFQFLGETFFHTAIALILAIILVELLLPLFNLFTDKAISHSFIISGYSPAVIASLLLLIGLLAGIYPALCLSRYQPMDLFKSKSTTRKRSLNPRKILVTSQFTISTCLIIATIMAFAQLQHLRNAQLGFEKDRIIVFKNAGTLTTHYYAFKQDLLQHPEIKHVTGMEDLLGINHNTRAYRVEGLEEEKNYYYPTFLVDWDFIQTFQIQILEGRAFLPKFPDDNTQSVVINQTMAQSLGWENHEALGKSIQSQYGQEKVIGVCEDFHVLSLHHPINKFIIDMYTRPEEFARIIAVRVKGTETKHVMGYIEKVWNRYNPTRPIAPQMLKEHLDQMYANEARFGRFFLFLTMVALTIACIGLIGLASFFAEQKNRELCLRKVHGASLNNLLGRMLKAFLGMLIFSHLIAWPLTWMVAERWLDTYASHTTLGFWIYGSAAAITILMLTLIIFLRTRISYKESPARVLKHQG